jgi:chain length determinant protein EpsF
MSFTQLLLTLRARIGTILLTFGLITLAVVAITLLVPKRYTATASVVVDVKPLDPIAGIALPNSVLMQSVLATQADILWSQRVALDVARTLKLDEDPELREEFLDDTGGAGSIEVWLADSLRKHLEIKPSRDSTVIDIRYTSRDQKLAPVVANAFAQAYIDITLDMKVGPAKKYASWFDDRAKGLRDELEQAQHKLSEYQRKTGILATDEQTDIENARLGELSSQLTVLQAQSADSRSRQRQAAQGPLETVPEVLAHPLVQILKTDIARAEARLEDLNAQVGENHPLVARTKSELKVLRNKLNVEVKRLVSGIDASNRINRQRENAVRNELNAQRGKVMAMKKEREQLSVLQQDVVSAQKAYDAVTARYTQTSLESQANQTNIYMLNPAAEPNRHSRPHLRLNTAVGAVLGMMLGIALALIRESFDRRVRSTHDLPVLPEMPLLARIGATGPGMPLLPAPNRLRVLEGRSE